MSHKYPLTDMLLQHKVAIITGAGQGLGQAYAQSLLDQGACVVISDLGTNRSGEGATEDVISEACRALRFDSGQLISHSGRLDNETGCRELIELAITRFGKLDILIHNAGWVDYQLIEDLDADFLERAIDINLRAPIWLSQYAWPYLKDSSSPRIVLTTSDRAMYQRYAQSGLVAYAAGKMAQVGIMNALSLEGEQHGILVNAISPVARTRMWGSSQPPADLKPEWVAPGVLYLASPLCQDTGYILRASNGQFTATRFCENPGVVYPTDLKRVECENVADVAAQWQQIKET
ncbi:putative short-chain type dehydrogenase/reductase [compost metagenome]